MSASHHLEKNHFHPPHKLQMVKDTVQLHAVRWFSLSTKDIGQVEDIAMQVWPRTDIARAEVLCYSRWRPGLCPDESDSGKFRLLKHRFCMHQEAELVGPRIFLLLRNLSG